MDPTLQLVMEQINKTSAGLKKEISAVETKTSAGQEAKKNDIKDEEENSTVPSKRKLKMTLVAFKISADVSIITSGHEDFEEKMTD
jgi:hypothetical protein